MVGELDAREVEDRTWSDKDIVIALVGPTASGKSSFVEQAAGIEGLSRGGLGSKTKKISVFKFPFPGLIDSSICLVDTPGIDGRKRRLDDIFDMIRVWFNETYGKERGLAGLLYFHPIFNTEKFRLSSMKHYFRCHCQNDMNRVVLTTTMWGGVDEGKVREDTLKRRWKPLIDEGASVKRFLNDPSSAFDILRPIVQAASSRQSTIGRALIVGRSLAATALRSLQRDSSVSSPVIVIIGPYGCGKSQFIDTLTQETAWANHRLQSHYHPVRSVEARVHNGNGSVVLVDTTGFDDDWRNAKKTLEHIYGWLRQNYKNSKVAGFLFLQNILDNHWIKPPPIPILHKVGGDDAIRNLIFVTTHWDWIRGELNSGIAKERHIRLRLEPLLRLGACMDRFDMETGTAWRILHRLL